MITTKTGDKGYSNVLNKRVKKNNKIFEAIGNLDELQSIIEDENIAKDLYEIMGEIGWEKTSNFKLQTSKLEENIVEMEKKLKPLTKFLIFRREKARRLNWIRTIVRRAERRVVALQNYELKITNYELIVIYLNRLSDYYYLMARMEEEKE